MASKSQKNLEASKNLALRDLEYAISLAIQLLSDLNIARAQIRILSDDHDGRMVVTPSQALALNAAVEEARRSCAAISDGTNANG